MVIATLVNRAILPPYRTNVTQKWGEISWEIEDKGAWGKYPQWRKIKVVPDNCLGQWETFLFLLPHKPKRVETNICSEETAQWSGTEKLCLLSTVKIKSIIIIIIITDIC